MALIRQEGAASAYLSLKSACELLLNLVERLRQLCFKVPLTQGNKYLSNVFQGAELSI